MRVVKTRVFDAMVLTFALALPSCSLMPKKALAPSASEWLESSSAPTSSENLSDNQKAKDANEAVKAEAEKSEPAPVEADITAVPEETDKSAEVSVNGDEEPVDETTSLKAALPQAENSGDQVRVLLVSGRLHALEPNEDHWTNVREDAEKILGAAAEPAAMEKTLKDRLIQVQKERREAESGRGKNRGDHKLAAEKRSLTEELSRREGRALSASVHVTVLDEERGRLMAKLEGGRTPDLLSQLKKANEDKLHWQKIVAAEKSETERINARLVELNSALKGREQDLKEAQDKKDNAREEEFALHRDLKLLRGWKAEFSRRQLQELKAQRKKDKEQASIVEKIMVSAPPEKTVPVVEEPEPVETVREPVKPIPSIEKKPLTPADITLDSFDPSAPLDEILSKFPEPSHQRAALNLLLWKMTSNDPRRPDAMKRLVALRGKGAAPSAHPVETVKEMPRLEEPIPQEKPAPVMERAAVMVPAPTPVRETVVVPESARQRILSGSEKTSISPNAFRVPVKKPEVSTEKPAKVSPEKQFVSEKREEKTTPQKHQEEKPVDVVAKESSVRALEKLLQAPAPEKWEVETQVEEKNSAPADIRPAKESSALSTTGAIVVYRVKTGDTLPALAKEMYGDPARWQEIYEANQNVILRGLLEPGQWLLIPRGIAR